MVQVVSVIMNTVNERQDYLKIAIESYLNQKNVRVELIISTVEDDPNIEFVKKEYPKCIIVTMPRKDHPISTGVKSPKGSFLQLNNALKYITGDWFTFASSNDFAYTSKCFIEISKSIEQKKEVCYSSYERVYSNRGPRKKQLFHDYNYELHLKGNFVSDCAMISRRLVDKYLPFNIELNNYAYWDLWLRIYEGEGNVFLYNKIPTWGYRQDPDSMHLIRSYDLELKAIAQKDKERMLKLHR